MIFSERFSEFVRRFEKGSAIAREILSRQNEDCPIGDYFDILTTGEVSYLPTGKELIMSSNGNGKWSKKNRVRMKPGRAIRKIIKSFGIDMHESELITFSDCVKAFNSNGLDIEIVDDVWYAYDYKNYHSMDGTLGASCMRHPRFKSVVSYYQELKAQVVCLVDSKRKIVARALLWPDVTILDRGKKLDEAAKFMDRIYSVDDSYTTFLKQWAADTGLWHKQRQSHSSQRNVVSPEGDEISVRMYVMLPEKMKPEPRTVEGRLYPYIDTFTYIHKDFLCNSTELGPKSSPNGLQSFYIYGAQGTSGMPQCDNSSYSLYPHPFDEYKPPLGTGAKSCPITGIKIPPGMEERIEGGRIVLKGTGYEIGGKLYAPGEIVYSYIQNKPILKKEAVRDCHDREYLDKDDPRTHKSEAAGGYVHLPACLWSEQLQDYIPYEDAEIVKSGMVLMKGRKMEPYEYRVIEGNPKGSKQNFRYVADGGLFADSDASGSGSGSVPDFEYIRQQTRRLYEQLQQEEGEPF